jgi:hypothetical protein
MVTNNVDILNEEDSVGVKTDVHIPSTFSVKMEEPEVSLVFRSFCDL